MKNCKNCNQALNGTLVNSSFFCANCGFEHEDFNVSKTNSLLITLCCLSIIGSVFTITRGLFYELLSSDLDISYTRGWVYITTSIGTIIGASMMMMNRLKGLYVYSIFQSTYIFFIAAVVLKYYQDFQSEGMGSLVFGVGGLFLIPSVLFLILYWTKRVNYSLK